MNIKFLLNNASLVQITDHLLSCNIDFIPPLCDQVEIIDYARKIESKSILFEAWSGARLVGLVAGYCNDQEKSMAYISNVSVLKGWRKNGIAENLLCRFIEHVKISGMRQINLKVGSINLSAIKLYEKFGFVVSESGATFVTMNLNLNNWDEYE